MYMYQDTNKQETLAYLLSLQAPKIKLKELEYIQVLHQEIDKAISKNTNIVVMGALNVNTLEMKDSSTSIDLILTNRRHHFKHTHAFETGLSDFHKVIITSFKSTYERLRSINMQYRCYKHFDKHHFLSDPQAVPFETVQNSHNNELAKNSKCYPAKLLKSMLP